MEQPPLHDEATSARRDFFASPLFVAAFLLLFALLLLWPLLRGTLYWGDIQFYFEPMWQYGQQELRQGRIPLWNDRVLAGQPFLGNPQMGVFYPVTLCLFFLPVWLTLSVASLIHIFLSGLFTYAYLRRRVLTEAALLGGMIYMGSDCLLGRLQFPPMIYTAAYFPLILWQLDRCLDHPRLSCYACLSASLGLMLLAGHAQFAYFILGTSIAYGLVRLWRARCRNSKELSFDWLKPAIPLLAASLVGLLLAAVQFLPTLQLLALSPREKLSPQQANRFVLDFPQLLQALWPRFFGHPANQNFWWRGNAWEPALFVGWLPLLLAGIALGKRHVAAQVRFWIVLGGLGLWLALGLNGGLYTLAFYVLPGLANFHDPARFLLITVFAISVLAAEGWEVLQDHWRIPGRYAGALLLVGAPLLWLAGDWNPTTNPANLEVIPAVAASLSQSKEAGRTYLPAHDLLWREVVTDGYEDFGGNDARSVASQRETMISNLGMQFGRSSSSGYEPVPLASTAIIDGLGRLAAREGQPNLSHVMSLTNANTLLLPHSLRFSDPDFRPFPSLAEATLKNVLRHRRVQIWRKASPSPVAWTVRQLRRVEGKTRIAATLASPGFDVAHECLVSDVGDQVNHMETREKNIWRELENAADFQNSAGRDGDKSAFAAVKAVHPQSGIYEVSGMSEQKPAVLVVASAAYPGWRGKIDGKPTPVIRANGVMLGVLLPGKAQRVSLVYAPDGYHVGLYLSLVALLLLSLVSGFTMSVAYSRWLLQRGRHTE